MGRQKKTKIKLDGDSLEGFMQEIYNDCINVMNAARRELNERKTRADVEDISDEYQIGKVNNETLKVIDSMIDKKLSLAKLQTQLIGDKSKSSDGSTQTNGGLSQEDKDTLREIFKKQQKKNNTEYDLDD
jgi:hypothetical protein